MKMTFEHSREQEAKNIMNAFDELGFAAMDAYCSDDKKRVFVEYEFKGKGKTKWWGQNETNE